MTRFARKGSAHGKKQREPEEATPWGEMVSTIKQREYNVEEDEDFVADDNINNENSEDDSSDDEEGETVVQVVQQEDDVESDSDANENDHSDSLNNEDQNSIKRKLQEEDIENKEPAKKKKKKNVKCKICGSKDHLKRECDQLPEERRKELQDLFNMKVERKGKGTGRKKKTADQFKLPYENDQPNQDNPEKCEDTQANGKKNDKKRKKKTRSKNNYKKEVRDRSGALVEKGEMIFHGFRVMKEDFKRLSKLNKELKSKGLSRDELETAMKKERRIAEKRLDRMKKTVCFKCRVPGHMLADCPQATDADKSSQAPDTGICFKCGSLEHKSKDCKSKLKGSQAYNFAVCFICKDKGHLAKACPDNPKGLYPNGGGCKFCGSVEHLKRDCARKIDKDLKKGVRAATMSDNVEDEPVLFTVGGGVHTKKKLVKKPQRIVKF